MRAFVAFVLGSLLLVACDSTSPTSPGDTILPFETVLRESNSGVHFQLRAVVRGAEEWGSLWQMIHTFGGQVPIPIPPPIDFDREMVVVAATGQRPDGCYAIDVARVTLEGRGGLEIAITETVPGSGCACTTALTQPVHVVKLARTAGPDRFVERREELRC